jgi:hypothetical protein
VALPVSADNKTLLQAHASLRLVKIAFVEIAIALSQFPMN